MYLHEDLKKYFSTSRPLFDQIMDLRGEVFRHQKGRLTQRVKLGEKYYFIKQHTGVGWLEIFKNVIQGRWPVISAENEWCAIEKLSSLGVKTAKVAGYGKRGMNPATVESFIIMEELAPTKSLEEITLAWRSSPPSATYKRDLIKKVARIARTMHENGINHKDFYLCHFLSDGSSELALIDLHRAQSRKQVPERWVIKDLAGLYFSSMHCRLTKRDLLRFMREYGKRDDKFWQKVQQRGEKLYRDHT